MRKNRIVNTVFTIVAVLGVFGLLIYGIYFNKLANERKIENDNNYQRTFYDLINYLEDSQNYILKAMSAGSEKNLSMMLDEAWKSSVQAEACISTLPLNQNLMENSSKYLVQLSDIARSWSDRAEGGLTDEEYETLSQMYGYAQDLTGTFETMAVNIISSDMSWQDISKISSDVFEGTEPTEQYSYFNSLKTTFTDYPSLIYDGPFSDSSTKTFSSDLPGHSCSEEIGKRKLNSFFKVMGEPAKSVNFSGNSDENGLKLMNFNIKLESGDKAYAALTCDGGHIYSISMYRDVKESKLSEDEAYKYCDEILKSMGYADMTLNYGEADGNCLTVNYSCEKDSIVYYPDMIKIKISLADGSLIAFDAKSYIFNHYGRKTFSENDAQISEEDARAVISPKLTVNDIRLAVIPKDNGDERFVYEAKCTGFGREILVYIDAMSGEECDILIRDSMDGYMR